MWRKEFDTRISKAKAVLREIYRSVVIKRELSNTGKLSVFTSSPIVGIRTTATYCRTTATWDNCHPGQLLPGQLPSQVCYGAEHVPTLFHVFLCSAMKVNTSIKSDSKICLKCC